MQVNEISVNITIKCYKILKMKKEEKNKENKLQVNEISVNITMYNILHVDVVESRIETQFQLKLSW